MRATNPKNPDAAKTKAEKLLLEAFRELETRHERNAVLVVLTSIAWGSLNKSANRVKLRTLFPEMQ